MNICPQLDTSGKFSAILKTIFVLISCMVLQLHGQGLLSNPTEDLKNKAARGDAISQNSLGLNYAQGIGVPKDGVEAVKWFRLAAAQNLATAQYNLGRCLSGGEIMMKDYMEAVKWFRKAANQNLAAAQCELGVCYFFGNGVTKSYDEAVKLYRMAANQGNAQAQFHLGNCYYSGQGTKKNFAEAAKWSRMSAEQNYAPAQYNIGCCYFEGEGVKKDYEEAVKWFYKAAVQNHAKSQSNLGSCLVKGNGVVKDEIEAYRWYLLATAQGDEFAKKGMSALENRLTRGQIAEGQRLARNFKPLEALESNVPISSNEPTDTRPKAFATGFFITEDGFLITNQHVIEGVNKVRLITSAGLISAAVVKVDSANDLALLKADGKFSTLSVTTSRAVKLGSSVATVGFPNIGLQGFAPKLAKGEIASLTGAADDARCFQISVPLQPGNSGGALVDERGNVVGVISSKLNASEALRTNGMLPENVNYAVKSSFLLSFLESVPAVSNRLKEPNAKEEKFENVVDTAQRAAVLILVY